ncbi:MAG: hypothetical protein GXO77_01500 [Calditrichaeota bacterium]|nr:hypothetical protein [Calditrichota bacterium]
MCHILLTMPFWGLILFYVMPLYLALPLYLLILVISGILYSVLMRGKHKKVSTGKEGMMGQMAEVIKNLNPVGQVLVHGEIWQAQSSDYIRKGEKAKIIGMEGLTLLTCKWSKNE